MTTVNAPVNNVATVTESTRVDFVDYDSANPITSSSGRVAKVLYKVKKVDGVEIKPERPNQACVIPFLKVEELQENMESLMPHLVSYLEGVQDQIIREIHSEHDSFEGNQIGLAAIVNHLESNSTSGKLSKERANAWFDEAMADKLAVTFADKLGIGEEATEEELTKLDLYVDVFKTKLSALVGPKTSYSKEEAEKLQKAIKITEADKTLIGARFSSRLDKMIKENQLGVGLLDL